MAEIHTIKWHQIDGVDYTIENWVNDHCTSVDQALWASLSREQAVAINNAIANGNCTRSVKEDGTIEITWPSLEIQQNTILAETTLDRLHGYQAFFQRYWDWVATQ